MHEKTFIRVEHKNSMTGMFRSDEDSICNVPELHSLRARHYGPFPTGFGDPDIAPTLYKEEEETPFTKSQWRFAFKNIEQINQWVMKDEFQILAKLNYRVYKITSNNYIESRHQVIFNINSVINKEDITELFI